MTTLEFVNKFIFQWFFIRLARCERNEILQANIDSVALMPNGDTSVRFNTIENEVYQWYAIHGFVLPLTGWSSDYIYLGKFTQPITPKRLKAKSST